MSMFLLMPLLVSVGLAAWAATGGVLRHAEKLHLVQAPNHRSSHIRPTPHGGGLGVVSVGTVAGIGIDLAEGWGGGWIILALGLMIAAVGLWDDIRPLSAKVRLGVQMGACGGLLLALMEWPGILSLPSPAGAGNAMEGWPLFALLLLGGVGWINLFNFMDGIDGLAGSQAVFMLIAGFLLAAWGSSGVESDPFGMWALCLAAASSGFLVRNWPPAKIFMGDVGSTWLAFMIFALGLVSVREGLLNYAVWLVLGAVFVADAMVTLLTRMVRGERWYEAHRSHAYQHLSRRWGSHRPVALLAIGINVLWLAPLALGCLIWPQGSWGIVILAYAPLMMGAVVLGAGRPERA